jgi:hypothetical protein
MIPLFAESDGSFGFHDLLTSVPPAAFDDTRVYFAAKTPQVLCNKIIHFATGVFWKAAVHPWNPGKNEPLIDLKEYAEPVRRYLKGEAPYPDDMILNIGILPVSVKLKCKSNEFPFLRGGDRVHDIGRETHGRRKAGVVYPQSRTPDH